MATDVPAVMAAVRILERLAKAWPDAVAPGALVRELGLNRLLVWGISGGGPHALACAALLPDLVVAVAALVGCLSAVPGIRRITAVTGADNIPSRRLLERLGFRVDGSLPDTGEVRYGLSVS